MRLHNRADRSNLCRRQNARKGRISLEILETRQLLSGSAGFLQGYVLGNSTNPVQVQLWDSTGTTELATTSTNSAGYYNFDAYSGLTAGTTYQITESNPGYTTSVTPSDIQTTINAASVSAIGTNAAIKVTVENLSTQSLTLTNTDLPYNSPIRQLSAYFQLNADLPYNHAGPFNYFTEDGDAVGQFDDYLTGNQGTVTGSTDNFVTLCTDLFDAINPPPPPIPFTVAPSLTPASTTLTTNLGELGYLYNTYGSSIQSNGPSTAATAYTREQIDGAGLQLALWALEYNVSPTSLASPNSPFQVLTGTGQTAANIITAADTYLTEAAGQSEDAYFLNVTGTPGPNGAQGMICTDLLNFTDTPQVSVSVSTAIHDSTGGPVTGALGEQVYDTATVTGTPFTPTGTVTYEFFSTLNGTGPHVDQTVTLNANGTVPNSALSAALMAGSYSYIGVYSGDSNYAPSTGAVEPLTINQATSNVSTAIFDSTGGPVTGALGEQAYDTATVTGTPFTPTGTVTYEFFSTINGTGPHVDQTVTLTGGVVPNSATTAALMAGSYSYIGVYSGDSNYAPSTGAVEPLTINQATSSVSTAIFDSSGGPVTGALGEQVYDTATVTGSPFTPTGTVTYEFFSTINGTGPHVDQTVTLTGGVVPNSATTAALMAGSYSYIGVYSGDSNYAPSTGAVEPLTINQATSSVSTAIFDSSGGPVTGALGEQVYDTATVTGTPFTPTGTVTYEFFTTINGTGPHVDQTVILTGGVVPNSATTAALMAGSYSYIGVYSGDSNYAPSTGAVEPLTINKGSSSVSTAIFDSTGGAVTSALGEKVYDTATVTGTPFTPTGTVTYEFFTNGTGTGTPSSTQTVTLNANGTVPNSAVSPSLTAGSYSYIGVYSGDSNYKGFTGAVEPLTVTGAPNVTVTKTADQSLIAAGQTAGFTVTITNNGTGVANGLTLNDPLPAGAGGDVNWTIDTSTGNPTDFTITGSQASQKLALSSSFFAAGDSLAPGQTIVVHITTPTTVADAGGNTTFAGAAAYLGGAVNYSVLYEGIGGHNLQITNVTTYGNIGVGGTGHVQFNGPGTIGGKLDFSAANTGQYSNNNSSNVGPTSANYNVAAVTTALSTVNGLNSSLAGLGNSLVINGNQTINESAGQLKTVNGVTYRVFNVTSYSEGNGNVVTINGDGSGDPVVFNFGSNSNVNLGGDVTLSGGLTDDQVLWNFTSSNQNISLNNNASSYPLPLAFHGIILAPNDAISLVNANFDGRVFGGGSSDMQIVSGDHINSPPGTLPNTATVSATGDTGQPGEQATATVTVANVSPCCNLQNVLFTVDNSKGQLVGTFSSLGGNTQQGDTVTVSFTVPTGVYDQLSLVSYVTPQPYFSASSAYLQQVFQSVTQVFGPGTHTIGPVTIPSSYYQIDFVCGTVISQLGLSPTDFYSAQGRLQSSDNGGTTIPSSQAGSNVCAGQTAAPSFWVNTAAGKGQALITSLNGGSTATNLGNWLATIAPNLFSSLQGETNTQVASYVKSLGSSSALSQVVATALAAYVTDSSLAGTVATAYGFTVTAYGTGVDNYSVSGSNASALGLSNGTYSIVTLLAAINSESSNGAINSSATTAANTIFGAINTAGKIS